MPFDKLYAYTSDEKGIRHALVLGDNEKIGIDEAIFFLSACTAFVGFLSHKKNDQEKILDVSAREKIGR